jgi:hypothetical protein
MKPEDLVKRLSTLKDLRSTWEEHWQDVGNFVYPRRRDFITMTKTKGEKRMSKVFDSTAIHANELLAAAIHGMLTNPATRWFRLAPVNADPANTQIRQWIEDVLDIMYSVFNSPQAGFSTAMFEDYMEYTAFGTSNLFVGEDLINKTATFQSRPLTESFIAENDKGKIDTVYRTFKWTVRQVVDRFGIDNVSNDVREAYGKQKFDNEVEILHAVQPRKDFNKDKKGNKNMPVMSIYIEVSTKHKLEEGGFPEMPYMVSRFYKAPMEIYGRSPAMTALPDVKMLNKMMETTIKAAQKVVDPPLDIPDDGFIYPFTTVPGGLNFRRRGENAKIETFGNSGNIPISLEMMNELRNRIRDTFFIDQLQLQLGPQMTLGEVEERSRRNMRILGPVAGRYQAEKLGPMIDRVFNILLRNNRFPEPPPVIQGIDLKVEYQGPLAKAQLQGELLGVERWIAQSTPFVQLNPNAGQRIDTDAALQELAELNGVSQKFMKSDEDFEADLAAAQETEAQNQILAQAESGGRAAKDIAQAENA